MSLKPNKRSNSEKPKAANDMKAEPDDMKTESDHIKTKPNEFSAKAAAKMEQMRKMAYLENCAFVIAQTVQEMQKKKKQAQKTFVEELPAAEEGLADAKERLARAKKTYARAKKLADEQEGQL